jgi:genome maintenance exonuclease 1
MTFTHLNKLGDFELEANTIDGVRYYTLPSGKKAPSITSITSFYNRQTFINWRKKVGEEEANKITKVATDRGTKFHDLVEKYLLNEDINSIKDVLPTTKARLIAAREALNRIDNIHALEKPLYSEYFGIAGRVDCIAEYDGELAIIDFKTSKKIKPEKWLENYFVQETAYACMYFEMTGIAVDKIVTLMVADNGDVHVYEKRNKGDYIKLLTKYIKEFVTHKLGEYGERS